MATPYQHADEICDHVYVSDEDAARDQAWLTSHGVTHVVIAARELDTPDWLYDAGVRYTYERTDGKVDILGPPAKVISMHYLRLDLKDRPKERSRPKSRARLERSVAWIMEAIRHPQTTVLIHCAYGANRSGTVACAFMMARNGWTRDQALAYLKTRRQRVAPSPEFLSILLAMEKDRCAMPRPALVGSSNAASASSGSGASSTTRSRSSSSSSSSNSSGSSSSGGSVLALATPVAAVSTASALPPHAHSGATASAPSVVCACVAPGALTSGAPRAGHATHGSCSGGTRPAAAAAKQ